MCVYVRVELVCVNMFHLEGTTQRLLLGYRFVSRPLLHAHIGAPLRWPEVWRLRQRDTVGHPDRIREQENLKHQDEIQQLSIKNLSK